MTTGFEHPARPHSRGASARWRAAGDEGDDRESIVLLPGLGGSHRDYGFILPMLARNHHVVCLDFDEDEIAVSSAPVLAQLVDQLKVTLDEAVPGRRISLVGNGIGAAVAVAYAASNHAADRLGRLVLLAGWLAPSARGRLFSSIAAVLGGHADAGSPGSAGAAASAAFARYAAFGGAALQARSADELDALPLLPPGPLTEAGLTLLATADLSEPAARIEVPTLVVAATEDAIVTAEQGRRLFAAIASARFAEIACGHSILIERPAQALSLIEGFVRDDALHGAGSILPVARV